MDPCVVDRARPCAEQSRFCTPISHPDRCLCEHMPLLRLFCPGFSPQLPMRRKEPKAHVCTNPGVYCFQHAAMVCPPFPSIALVHAFQLCQDQCHLAVVEHKVLKDTNANMRRLSFDCQLGCYWYAHERTQWRSRLVSLMRRHNTHVTGVGYPY